MILLNKLRARNTERVIEVPLALQFLEAHHKPLYTLEVGNTLHNYTNKYPRTVVDKYEVGPGVRNIDVFDIDIMFETIVSVSTLEHVGHDKPECFQPGRAVTAVHHLRSLLMPGGNLFITVPVGWNYPLDEFMCNSKYVTAYKRVAKTKWEQCDKQETVRLRYGFPYRWSNGIFVYQFNNPTVKSI